MPYERLKLISNGTALEDEKSSKPVVVNFVDGGTDDLPSFSVFLRNFCQDSQEYIAEVTCYGVPEMSMSRIGCTDFLIAMVSPKPPPSHVSSRDGEIEDEDEDLVSSLSPCSCRRIRVLYFECCNLW